MRKFITLVGFAAMAVVSCTVVYLYMNDREVHDKINDAAKTVGEAAKEVTQSVRTIRKDRQSTKDSVSRNQAWADEQWDTLGI